MNGRARKSSTPSWPFWLLLTAWACTNLPQVALFTALTWVAEGRSFTHQQRLTRDVARVLAGETPTRPIGETVARAQEQAPSKPLPPVPAEAVMKKIELSLETTSEVLPSALRASQRIDVGWRSPEPRRRQPPHDPPRTSRV